MRKATTDLDIGMAVKLRPGFHEVKGARVRRRARQRKKKLQSRQELHKTNEHQYQVRSCA